MGSVMAKHKIDLDGHFAEFPDGTRRRLAIDSTYLHKIQKRHFLLYDTMPLAGTIAAIALLPLDPIGMVEFGLFFSFWLMTGIGITVGFHRLFTHRAFSASPQWTRMRGEGRFPDFRGPLFLPVVKVGQSFEIAGLGISFALFGKIFHVGGHPHHQV